jgi:membrane protein YqaA with SNARE-associated domain
MNGIAEMGLGWLFLSAFTSATLLPGSSEVLLGAMAVKGEWSMTACCCGRRSAIPSDP